MKRKIIYSLYLTTILILSIVGIKILLTSNDFVPTFKNIKQVNIMNLSEDNLSLSISIDVINSSFLSQNLKDGTFKLMVNNDSIGNAILMNESILKSNSIGTMNMLINFNPKKISKILSQQNQNLAMILEGKITTEILFINLNHSIFFPIDIDLNETLNKSFSNQANSNKLIKIVRRIVKVRFDSTFIVSDFQLNNPYKIDYTINSFPCKIFIHGVYAGDGNIEKPIKANKEQIQSVGKFVFVLNNKNTLTSISGGLLKLNTSINYETKGILNLHVLGYDISFPYHYSGELIKDATEN